MSKHAYNAEREVSTKKAADIERETAQKWAARAVACHRKWLKTGKQIWLIRAERYRDEALEHAAMVEDHGKTVAVIQKKIDDATR